MTSQAQDRFELYFAEKLWEMIPAVYRHEDGTAANPGVLRALVEVLAEQAAVVRRSHDRLWEDQFIDLCDDWAVPYIADLLGTRLVSALNLRARRVDVAKTIYYRRRKGTPRILEELISDIAGWEGVVVENFRRLARTRHALDPRPAMFSGRISGTGSGGWADLRKPRVSDLVGWAFDEFHYTPDVRRHNGTRGRHAIPKLSFYLYRVPSYRVKDVTPCALSAAGRYTFDPSGRDVALFAPRGRAGHSYDWDDWRSLREWELPGPIGCRLLNDFQAKPALIPGALSVSRAGSDFGPDSSGAADLGTWMVPAVEAELIVDPRKGRFLVPEAAGDTRFAVSYHYGFPSEVGAGTYARSYLGPAITDVRKSGGGNVTADDQVAVGVLQFDDSATYDVAANPSEGIRGLEIRSANGKRPYVRLSASWALAAAAAEVGEPDAALVIDGLWLGGEEIILSGNYEKVVIRHATLDPGGRDAEDREIATLHLVIEGYVEKLEIKSAIVGAIETRGDGLVEQLELEDSIVHAVDDPDGLAINLPDAMVQLRRITVLGGVCVKELYASEALVTGNIDVRNVQAGCFRFSAAPQSAKDSLPRPYRVFWIPASGSAHYFASRRFGDFGYGQLTEAAPQDLREGAENGSEIGAYSSRITPIRSTSLDAKATEYMPFGLVPVYVNVT